MYNRKLFFWMDQRFCPHLYRVDPGGLFGGLAVLVLDSYSPARWSLFLLILGFLWCLTTQITAMYYVLEGRLGTSSSGHFNGSCKIAAVGRSLHSPSRACSYAHLLPTYNSHTLQLFNVETAALCWCRIWLATCTWYPAGQNGSCDPTAW